jgi:hypothetical protein
MDAKSARASARRSARPQSFAAELRVAVTILGHDEQIGQAIVVEIEAVLGVRAVRRGGRIAAKHRRDVRHDFSSGTPICAACGTSRSRTCP